MATEWQLEYDATTQSLADWGLSQLSRRRLNLGVDTVFFQHDGKAFDGTPLFPVGATIKIHRVVNEVSTQWFEGRVDRVPRFGAVGSENQSYQVVGPWWYLERLVFMQNWNVADDEANLSPVYKSRVLLFQNLNGTKQNVASQLAEVLAYAKTTAGKPLDYDTTDFPALEVPIDEGQDLTCAEVIRRALRWTPDAVAWWDYSTSPPTFHIKQRADLAAGSLDLASSTAQVNQLEIGSREDLQIPAVFLKFEQVSNINGQSWHQVTEQKAPNDSVDGTETSALVATIQLEGYSETRVTAAVEVETIAETSAAWWQARFPWLADGKIVIQSVTDTSRNSTLPRMLVRGQLASWMGVNRADDTVAATITYKVYSSTTVQDETTFLGEFSELMSVAVTATDAVTNTYSVVDSFSSAEPIPTGLAQALYDANATLQWEGALAVVEQEISGAADLLGSTLDLTNGHVDWETMAAVVQEVAEFVDNGTTRIRFGPAQHLGPADLIELLRVNRSRRIFINPATRTDGLDYASAVALGNQTPRESPSAGNSQVARMRIGNKATATKGEIDLDPSAADVTTGTGYIIKPRWTHMCDEDTGEDRYALIMRSQALSALPAGATVED